MRYESNFLASVLARVDFVGEVPFQHELPSDLKAELLKTYPVMEPQRIDGLNITVKDGTVSPTQLQHMEWRFHDKAREKHLTIGPGYMWVQFDAYDNSELLLEGFVPQAKAVAATDDVPAIRRLGLRFINNVKSPHGTKAHDWSTLIASDLLYVMKSVTDAAPLTRSVGIQEFNYGDHLLRFMFGLHNPDYPAAIRKEVFLLDYDAYLEAAIAAEEVEPLVRKLHTAVDELFEASIVSGLREIMGVQDVS